MRDARFCAALVRALNLDQLQRFAARAFDHHRASVAERVRLLEERDALAAELGDPAIEIGDAKLKFLLRRT
jgi:hypothetical protein